MYLDVNLSTISLSLIGVQSIILFLVATPSLWPLSFLPDYIIVVPSDVVTQPLPVHLHSLMSKISLRKGDNSFSTRTCAVFHV